MDGLLQDLRYALRTLWKGRGFATIAIVTLALGIGASTVIFSVIENVLLAPFPYKDAARLASVHIQDTKKPESYGRAGYAASEFLEFAEQNHVFDRVIGAGGEEILYKQGEGAERLDGAQITPGTFELFGMPALLGRVAQPADYEPGAPPVFVLRYKTWVNRFNADPSILNKIFVLNGTPRTLIGITPPRFGWYDADVFLPTTPTRVPSTNGASSIDWFVLGHLKKGVSTSQAEVDLAIIAKRLANIYPNDYPEHFSVKLVFLGDGVTSSLRPTLYTVIAAVGLLLLISCSNVANLMLARATAREKELVLRAVLGAGRSRLVQQLLVESLLLALSGAVLGTFFAWSGLKSMVAAIPQDLIPAESVIQINAPALAFTLCLAMLTALIFGLAPALQAARRELNNPLRDNGKGLSAGLRNRKLRDAVVILEVASSLVLLVGAGLLMRSFVALRETSLGVQPDHVLVIRLPLPQDRYKTADKVAALFRPLLTRLKALPGVIDAAEASSIPPFSGIETQVEISGKSHDQRWTSLLELCSEGYFPVLRTQFKSGRSFTEAEVIGARKLAVVNQTFVRKYLESENPLGQRVHLAQLETLPDRVPDAWFEIVGVIADIKNQGLQDPVDPEVWIPDTVTASASRSILVRTIQSPLTMLHVVQHEIWSADSGIALSYSNSLEGFINSYTYAGPRFAFLVMAIFGSVGLILVTIGVYSVLAYTTARKTQEIGIRMALGAESADVLRLVIKTGLRLVVAGIAIGLTASLFLGRLIEAQLWQVSSYDPATLAGVALLLLTTGVVACSIPARRASRVDPLNALRYE